jgi:hypothetical protein
LDEKTFTGPSRGSESDSANSGRSGIAGWAWIDFGSFFVLVVEMGLLLLLVRAFSIESAAFFRVFALAAAGFIVHSLLPLRLRMPFFVLLSLAGIVMLFGAAQGAWLVGLGMLLIGLAHIPVRFAVRLVLILAAGGALAVFRAGAWESFIPSGIWTIFGSMFMFRMIVYMYDLKNRAAPFGLWRGMAYFFMLPNVCFPLFPVVDYKTMSRGHYEIDPFETYQTGVDWIFRGLIQLILYRVVYQYLSQDPAAVDSAAAAALYLVRPYLLYLRISGSFHLVIGMMHLFGFNLPRTNYYYFLASSFTDYWRRINIYWKEFIEKIFFKPFYFHFSRRMNGTAALILATLIAFFATWALHSYQWFWIRRSFPVIWQDIAFWSVMGLVVLANMIHEARRGRRRSLGTAKRSLRSDIGIALRTVGTFLVICASWAVWSSQSSGELGLMLEKLLRPGPRDAAWILGGLVGLGLVSVLIDRLEKRGRRKDEGAPRLRLAGVPLSGSVFRVSAVSAVLVFVVYAQLYFFYPPAAANVINRLRNPFALSGGDAQMLDRGYYEDLTDVVRFNPQLAKLYSEKPPGWDRCWAVHRTGGFPTHEVLPSRQEFFKGAAMSTNRWGMRDRDYEKAKPQNTYRFVLSGASHSMGTGVEDDESFENIVEDRLNSEIGAGTGLRYEILNFSVGGYGPAARLSDLESRMLGFEPDAFILVGIHDLHWVVKEVAHAAMGTYEFPWPEPLRTARSAGVDEGMEYVVAYSKLNPHREELLGWVYRRMVELCEGSGVLPIAAYIPQPRDETPQALVEIRKQMEIAREAGFIVIDMLGAFASADGYEALWIAKWDRHPNAEGHRLLADELYAGLRRELDLTSLRPGTPYDRASGPGTPAPETSGSGTPSPETSSREAPGSGTPSLQASPPDTSSPQSPGQKVPIHHETSPPTSSGHVEDSSSSRKGE